MRKDIYIVSVNTRGHGVKLSQEGYTTIDDAIKFIESRSDKPVKDRYTLSWRSPENVYQLHIIKVGD